MNKKLSQLIDESIKLELNVAKIYMFFSDTFPEDSNFWWQLGLEENWGCKCNNLNELQNII